MYAEPRRCNLRGCPWRGTCPDHGMIAGNEASTEMNKLLRMRPFGESRKRQRQPDRYDTPHATKCATRLPMPVAVVVGPLAQRNRRVRS